MAKFFGKLFMKQRVHCYKFRVYQSTRTGREYTVKTLGGFCLL